MGPETPTPLPPTDAETALIDAALAARANAYAPYSNFHVGAAIRDENGDIHGGCNVENAAYPQSQCAEATAIGAMATAGGTRISMIVVTGPEGVVCTPCGGCRQRISEFAAPQTPVILASAEGVWARTTLGALLPASFSAETIDEATDATERDEP